MEGVEGLMYGSSFLLGIELPKKVSASSTQVEIEPSWRERSQVLAFSFREKGNNLSFRDSFVI